MRISNAHDAYWFLYDHPKFSCPETTLAISLDLDHRLRNKTIKDSEPGSKVRHAVHEYKGMQRRALVENLDIFYTKVDVKRKINDDAALNTNVECWLEFGIIKFAIYGGHLRLEQFHDIRLDVGASTFDEALVKLARKVKKHYGDYKNRMDRLQVWAIRHTS